MIKILCFIFLVVSFSCSKNQGQGLIAAPAADEEIYTADTLLLSEQGYYEKLGAFRASKEEKLATQKLAFESYQTSVGIYLKNLDSRSQVYKDVKKVFADDFKSYERLKVLIQDFFDRKKSLRETNQRLDFIKETTNNFQLNLIEKHGLADETASLIQSYKKKSSFLKRTFPKDLTLFESYLIKINRTENKKFNFLIVPYLKEKKKLSQAEKALSKVDFSFNKEDHTVAGLTHELAFFKALDKHLKLIEAFKTEDLDFLSADDLGEVRVKKEKIRSTLEKLKDMREIQKFIGSDLQRMKDLGYHLSVNLQEYQGDELYWTEHEVSIESALSSKKVKWEVGIHPINPFDIYRTDDSVANWLNSRRVLSSSEQARVDNIIVNKLWARVDVKSYYKFDEAFGEAFSLILTYISDNSLPEKKEKFYIKLSRLLLETYTKVTNYYDKL